MTRRQVDPQREDVPGRVRTQRVDQSPPSSQRRDGVAAIQRSVGNQTVQRLADAGPHPDDFTVSQPGDPAEREAERVAEQVTRTPSTEPSNRPNPTQTGGERVQRLCDRCQRRYQEGKPLNCEDCEATLRRATAGAGEAATSTRVDSSPGPAVERQIQRARGGGRPLPEAQRTYFESQFGRDFGDVRVHTGPAADEATRSLAARAFTIGRDIVFRSAAYEPGSNSGRRLLAHELTHVVQQDADSSRPPQIYRQEAGETDPEPKEPAAEDGASQESPRERRDVALLLSPGADETAKALTVSPDAKRLRVSGPAEMANKLSHVTEPIGRLLVFSHSATDGSLGFESGSSVNYVRPGPLATALEGAVPPERGPNLIDFRGCSLGTSPAGMEQLRTALNAEAAIGGNCYMVSQVQGPVVLSAGDDSTPITSRDQLTEANRDQFEAGLEMLREAFGPAKGCILDDSEDAYFRAGGRFVAMWASPGGSTEWDERTSKCYDELTTTTVDPATAGRQEPGLAGNCQLIRIEDSSGSSGTQGATQRPGTGGSTEDSGTDEREGVHAE